MTETADNYADENSTVAERTSLHVETYINSDIMINLVISYLILESNSKLVQENSKRPIHDEEHY